MSEKMHTIGHRRICLFGAMLIAVAAAGAQAGVAYNDWNYALDSTSDGSGGSSYEMLGIAYKQVGSQLYFALSGNMPIGGNYERNALNNHISPGDLFLNFSGHNLTSASDFSDPNVFAIRFSATNDSLGNTRSYQGNSNLTVGLFSNITAVSKARDNEGYGSLQSYINAGYGRNSKSMGDLQSTNTDVVSYLGNGAMFTNISSGTQIANLSLLSGYELITDGLDFAHFGSKFQGNEIYGFVVDASQLPAAGFTAHVFEECSNDGMAIIGQVSHTTSVPEPATLALIGLGGLAIMLGRRKA